MCLFNLRQSKLVRRVVCAVMAVVLMVGVGSMCTASAHSDYHVGDVVLFGSYEQNNIKADGAEAIEWLVLDVRADRMLLLSRYALDSERYHYRKESVSWDTCSVRGWLNDTFLYDAFTRTERACILSSDTSKYADYVFLLSDEEVELYLPRAKDRICYATEYGSNQNVYVNPSTGGSWWLLRTTGNDGSMFAMSVNSDGTIDYNGGHVESDRGTVRPAVWVSI